METMTEKQHKCDQCDFRTDSERGLSIHVGHEHGKNVVTCGECGDEFERPPSLVEGNERTFCSKECMARGYATGLNEAEATRCEVCGELYQYYPSVERGRFCSRECLYESGDFGAASSNEHHLHNPDKYEVGECIVCGERFPYDSTEQTGKYCSHECWMNSDEMDDARVRNDGWNN